MSPYNLWRTNGKGHLSNWHTTSTKLILNEIIRYFIILFVPQPIVPYFALKYFCDWCWLRYKSMIFVYANINIVWNSTKIVIFCWKNPPFKLAPAINKNLIIHIKHTFPFDYTNISVVCTSTRRDLFAFEIIQRLMLKPTSKTSTIRRNFTYICYLNHTTYYVFEISQQA